MSVWARMMRGVSESQAIAEELFESLRRHVMMARLSPAGGALFALTKIRQSYSVSRNRPLYFELADPVQGMELVTRPTLATVQIDNQTKQFGPDGEYYRWFNRAAGTATRQGRSAGCQDRLLRLLRHDIIHHKARVSDARREKRVVLKWFDEGEEIAPGRTHYADLFSGFPWAELGAVVLDPPPLAPVDTRLASTPFDALMQLPGNPGSYFFPFSLASRIRRRAWACPGC
ncbi:hypothetical protein [Nocardia sp. NPDC059239]|uniref:hypothetical protein n=1 Tax=unclassified Nocardia TaxID=2637762 RepID=UPI003687C1C9